MTTSEPFKCSRKQALLRSPVERIPPTIARKPPNVVVGLKLDEVDGNIVCAIDSLKQVVHAFKGEDQIPLHLRMEQDMVSPTVAGRAFA
jgi:hypothetical protein